MTKRYDESTFTYYVFCQILTLSIIGLKNEIITEIKLIVDRIIKYTSTSR